jgi:hypothetical protein
MSLNSWTPNHDTCVAECRVAGVFDDATRTMVWDRFSNAPAPVGHDPRMIPAWTSPTANAFAVLRLDPWRLRVFPGSRTTGGGGTIYTWQAE